MDLERRIKIVSGLKTRLENLGELEKNGLFVSMRNENQWFDKANSEKAIEGIVQLLDEEKIKEWLTPYKLSVPQNKKIGVVSAGNIPAVGFHDVLCVFLTGNYLKLKLSSGDKVLMQFLLQELLELEPEIINWIQLVPQLKLDELDAVIATGSNNTSRYFEQYFQSVPHIIRKNRSSVAVLKGNESKDELSKLGHDIFTYYGLGCRNISKVLVPKGYVFDSFFESIEEYNEITHHHKYSNNYDYNKSVYLVNREPHFDNGFLIVKKDEGWVSPISVLFYEEYESPEEVTELLKKQEETIQCLVGDEYIPFGQAQLPSLSDYADGVDTIEFLKNL